MYRTSARTKWVAHRVLLVRRALSSLANSVHVHDQVHSYTWDSDTGTLTELSELMLHDGAGPRHMCFSPDGTHAYILGELDNSVTVCSHTDGVLTVEQTLNSLVSGTEHATAGGAAEIIISPDGRFVYATIRGTCAVVEDPYPHNYAFNVIGAHTCCAWRIAAFHNCVWSF